jgi:hypothetical protein
MFAAPEGRQTMAHTFTNLHSDVILEFIAMLKRHGIAYDERYIWE